MPSPFPGMDPFIEGQSWKGFHDIFLGDLRDALNWSLPERYVADVQERVTVVTDAGERTFVGDLAVHDATEAPHSPAESAAPFGSAATVTLTLPEVEEEEDGLLEIRESDTGRLVTTVELLSPKNKRGTGRVTYLDKRAVLLGTDTHLVEIDLLRGGRRLPTVEPLPPGDYYVFISRSFERPSVRVMHWGLPDPLPQLPIPLRAEDGACGLPLGELFRKRYDAANYGRILNYRKPVAPSLPPDDAAWAAERLAAAGAGGG